MKKFKKGFTLLELLVVIGIIAILIGVGAASYSTAQKKARDAKRKSDLKSVQACIEQYYSTRTTSPFTYNIFASPLSGPIDCGPTQTMTAPTDPLNDETHKYVVSDNTSSTYTITATLEIGDPFVVKQQQ